MNTGEVLNPSKDPAKAIPAQGGPRVTATPVTGNGIDQAGYLYTVGGTVQPDGSFNLTGKSQGQPVITALATTGGRSFQASGRLTNGAASGSFSGTIGSGSLSGQTAQYGSCQTLVQSGGQGTFSSVFNVGVGSTALKFFYEAFRIPDGFLLQGKTTLLNTGLVSGNRTVNVTLNGETSVSINVFAPLSGTAWNFSLDCAAAPSITLTTLSGQTDDGGLHSFLSTDTLGVTAQIQGLKPGDKAQVHWTLEGQDAASGVNLKDLEKTLNVSGSQSVFTFKPSSSSTFVSDRKARFTQGSFQPNPPIALNVKAELMVNGKSVGTTDLASSLGVFRQHEIEILLQEYIDYGATGNNMPVRSDVIPAIDGPARGDISNAGYNAGLYNYQLGKDMISTFNKVQAAYQGHSIVGVNDQALKLGGMDAIMPTAASFTVESGFRDPQKNRMVGSLFPFSKHTLGHALDLIPTTPVTVSFIDATGKPQVFNVLLHDYLYPSLLKAAKTQGIALTEKGNVPVPVGNATENHVHVQW